MSAIKVFLNGIILFSFFLFIGYISTIVTVLIGMYGAKLIVSTTYNITNSQTLTSLVYNNANSWLKMFVLFGKYSPWVGLISMIVYWVVSALRWASREVLMG